MNNKRLNIFNDLEVEPSSGVWASIKDKLPEQKKKRNLIIFFAALLCICLLIGVGFYFINNIDVKKAVGVIPVTSPSDINSKNIETRNDKTNSHLLNQEEDAFSTGPKDPEEISNKGANSNVQNNIEKSKINSENSKAITKTKKTNMTPDYFPDENILAEQETNKNVFNSLINNHTHESDDETEILKQNLFSKLLDEYIPDQKLIERMLSEESGRSLSKWSVFAGVGIFNSIIPNRKVTEQNSGDTKGLSSAFYTAGLKYDASSRLNFTAGFSLFNLEQKTFSLNKIFLHGQYGNPAGSIYTITTPVGSVSGNGQEFEQTFFNSSDSSLFPQASLGIIPADSFVYREMNISNEFKYLSVPIGINYKFFEGVVTPFAGIIFTYSYLLDKQIRVNDKKINYEYDLPLSNHLFAMGLSAGLSVNIIRRFSIFTSASYQQQLNSIIEDDKTGKRKLINCSIGVCYRL